jgi:hypothetical protein
MRTELFLNLIKTLGKALLGACRDLAPIVFVIAIFQILVLRQPFPELVSVLAGLGLVIVGLALFVVGLDIGLFPLGEALAEEFARKSSLVWLLVFAFALGFGTTVAEPALIAVTREGAKAAADAVLIDHTHLRLYNQYAFHVRLDRCLFRWDCNRCWRVENTSRMVIADYRCWRLYSCYGHDAVRAQGDCGLGLRFRRRYHINGHCTPGNGFGGRVWLGLSVEEIR